MELEVTHARPAVMQKRTPGYISHQQPTDLSMFNILLTHDN